MNDGMIKNLKAVHAVQGYEGNWNYSPYMHGMYNGLEFALSMIEGRPPEFKDAPDVWGQDTPDNYELSSESDKENDGVKD